MTTPNGFHSMSEERRIRMQLSERTDMQLAALVAASNPNVAVRTLAAAMLRERHAAAADMHAGEA